MSTLKNKKYIKISIYILLIIIGFQLFERFSFLNSVEKNIWSSFLGIREPAGCKIIEVNEGAWWSNTSPGRLLTVNYEITDGNINELIENINSLKWFKLRNHEDMVVKEGEAYCFGRASKKLTMFLRYNKKNKILVMTIVAN